MPRLRPHSIARGFVALAVALSLLLLLATLIVWARSEWTMDVWGFETSTDAADRRGGGTVRSTDGTLEAVLWIRHTPHSAHTPGYGWTHFSARLNLSDPLEPIIQRNRDIYLSSIGAARFAGIVWAHYQSNPSPAGGLAAAGPVTQNVWHLEIPFYVIALASVLLPAWRLIRHLRRPKPGFCQTCGYDLRASPRRCPECGSPAMSRPGSVLP